MNQAATNLQSLRRDKNTSQVELAEKLNVSQNVVSRIEQGKRKIDIQILESYATIFRISIEEILNYHLNKPGSTKQLLLEEQADYDVKHQQTYQLLKQYSEQLELRIKDLNFTIELLKSKLKDEQSKVAKLQNKQT